MLRMCETFDDLLVIYVDLHVRPKTHTKVSVCTRTHHTRSACLQTHSHTCSQHVFKNLGLGFDAAICVRVRRQPLGVHACGYLCVCTHKQVENDAYATTHISFHHLSICQNHTCNSAISCPA